MTNVDSVLKSIDIALLTNVHIVKAMVFPVVMYRCESWAVKKGWTPKNWCLWTMVLEKTLESSLQTARRSNQSILKEINPEYSLEGQMLKLKLQYFGHLMQRTDWLEKTLILGKIEGRRRRGWRRMRWLDDITDSMDMFEQAPGVGEGQESLVRGVTKSWTQLRGWMATKSWGLAFGSTCKWLKVYGHRNDTIRVCFMGSNGDSLEK